MKIIFPDRAGRLSKKLLEKYYRVYYSYVLNIFKTAGCEISLTGDTAISDGVFWIKIDGKKVLIDYSDYLAVAKQYHDKDVVAYFKFHCSINAHDRFNKLYPFPPVSFYDWEKYNALEKEIKYIASSNIISCRQKPYGNARFRRAGIHSELKKHLKRNVVTALVSQEEYWKEIEKILVSIFIPGCREDMLDRGHLQYLGFGCPTVSTQIITYLPFWKTLEPGKHFVECRKDYLDIFEKIAWCKINQKELIQIGDAAKKLFQETGTPQKIVQWVKEVLEGKHERKS